MPNRLSAEQRADLARWIDERELAVLEECAAMPAPCCAASRSSRAATSASLERDLEHLDAGFGETLLALIDGAGLTDAEAYRAANVSRQLFAKIRRDPRYQPTKATACAFAIALGLSEKDAQDLLGRAGYALTRSSRFDVICLWAIDRGITDVQAVNEALYSYDQPLLGSQPR